MSFIFANSQFLLSYNTFLLATSRPIIQKQTRCLPPFKPPDHRTLHPAHPLERIISPDRASFNASPNGSGRSCTKSTTTKRTIPFSTERIPTTIRTTECANSPTNAKNHRAKVVEWRGRTVIASGLIAHSAWISRSCASTLSRCLRSRGWRRHSICLPLLSHVD